MNRHKWNGDCHLSVCVKCGISRQKRRKRLKGTKGSSWHTWYARDPDTDEPNRAGKCKERKLE